MTTIVRRLAGTVAVILLGAGALLLFRFVAAPPEGSAKVTAVLGEAGQNLVAGSDVKMRDVLVGTVKSVELNDRAQAVAELIIWPTYRVPADVEVRVNSKTLLGERYVELIPHGPLSEGPELADGARLVVAQSRQDVTEVQDLLDAMDPVFAALDPVDVGTLVDEFGSFTADDARLAARNIEVSARLADFGAETAEEQTDRLSSLATLTGELATTAEDFNRLNRTLPRWVSFLPDRQAAVRNNLEALSAFALTTAEFLEVEEETIGRLLRASTRVGGVLAGRADELSSMIQGAYRYAFSLSQHGGTLNDGTEFGWFRSFLGGEGEIARLCAALPEPLRAQAPGCLEGNTADEDQSDQGDFDEQDEGDEGGGTDGDEDHEDDAEGDGDGGGNDEEDNGLPLPGGGGR